MIRNRNFKIAEEELDSYEAFEKHLIQEKFDYFRGESDSKWSLNSSMVRKIICEEEKFILNRLTLDRKMEKYIKEYDLLLNKNHRLIRKLFYTQHAISYSPFIDITRELWIAVSFCLGKCQEESSRNFQTKGAIYALKIHGNQKDNPRVLRSQGEVEDALNDLSIEINNKNPSKLQNGMQAYILNINEMALLNDRMQYQKGAFLLLNNYSTYKKDHFDQEYNDPNIEMKKYILSIKLMEELKHKLNSEFKEYTLQYLEDPYKFLKDI